MKHGALTERGGSTQSRSAVWLLGQQQSGKLLEMQDPGPTPDLLKSEPVF